MDWSALVALISVMVAFGGVIVAFFSVAVTALGIWLAYQERVAGHRQAIYQKQMEAFNTILAGCFAFHGALIAELARHPRDWTASHLQVIRKALDGDYDRLYNAFFNNILFIPGPIAEALLRVSVVWNRAIDNDEYWAAKGPRLVADLETAILDLMADLRAALGIQPLSREISSIVRRR